MNNEQKVDSGTSCQTIGNTLVVGSPSLSEKRVIKFRGKSTIDGTLVFGNYIYNKQYGSNYVDNIPIHP